MNVKIHIWVCVKYLDKDCQHWFYLILPDIAHDQRPLSQIWHSEKIQHAASSDCVLCLQLTDHSFTLQTPLKTEVNVVLLRQTSITFSSRDSETFLPLIRAAFRIIFLASSCLPWVRSHRADSGRILKTVHLQIWCIFFFKRIYRQGRQQSNHTLEQVLGKVIAERLYRWV